MRDLKITAPQLADLFKRLGGETGLARILDKFYEKMSRDVMLGFFFSGKDLHAIARMQMRFLMRAWGASQSYPGKSPADAHAKLPPILSGHFDRRLTILAETLREEGLSEEDVALWVSFENKFREAVQHS